MSPKLTEAASQPPVGDAAHPLLYASLTPIDPLSKRPRIDLYKPKAEYSIGRNPQSDIVLDSQHLDWSVCSLKWDGRNEVRVVDLFSVNGIWINRRRLPAGGSRILQDGDTIFFSLSSLRDFSHSDTPPPLRYQLGADNAYTYRQYTDRPPPLSSADQSVRARLDTLEHSCRHIDEELERLKQEKEAMLREHQAIVKGLPEPPPSVRSNRAKELQKVWDDWDGIRARKPLLALPEDFRELCRPDTDDLPYDEWWREEYETNKYEIPPPLRWGAPMAGLTDVYHRPGWPDWNNPDLVWGGPISLDQSRPLTIPPSIIYWSAQHRLPVYAHPRFDPDSTRTYARPYAQSNAGFSDYSSAKERQDLGLPPLDEPPIIRPRDVLYSLGGLPDEDELAKQVAAQLATLRPDDELLPPPSPKGSPKPRNARELAAKLKDCPYFLDIDAIKRKRALADDGDEDEIRWPGSPSPRGDSPVADGKTAREDSLAVTKRRKISPSPSPAHSEAPGALGVDTLKESA